MTKVQTAARGDKFASLVYSQYIDRVTHNTKKELSIDLLLAAGVCVHVC